MRWRFEGNLLELVLIGATLVVAAAMIDRVRERGGAEGNDVSTRIRPTPPDLGDRND